MNKRLFILMLAKWFAQIFLNNLPIGLLIFLVIAYFSLGEGVEEFELILSCIGISFAISSLAFRASSVSKEERLKKIYRQNGEMLFHATLLFIFTLIIHFFLHTFNYVLELTLDTAKIYLFSFIIAMLRVSFWLVLIIGLLEAGFTLHTLNGLLFKRVLDEDSEDQWKLKL